MQLLPLISWFLPRIQCLSDLIAIFWPVDDTHRDWKEIALMSLNKTRRFLYRFYLHHGFPEGSYM